MLQHKDIQKVGIVEMGWGNDGRQVPVQVHRRDPYERKHPRNARTGPSIGPVRALVYVRLGTGGYVKRLYSASYKWPRA